MPALVYHENICKSRALYVNRAYTVQMLLFKGPDVPLNMKTKLLISLQQSITGKGKISTQEPFENLFHTSNVKPIQM